MTRGIAARHRSAPRDARAPPGVKATSYADGPRRDRRGRGARRRRRGLPRRGRDRARGDDVEHLVARGRRPRHAVARDRRAAGRHPRRGRCELAREAGYRVREGAFTLAAAPPRRRGVHAAPRSARSCRWSPSTAARSRAAALPGSCRPLLEQVTDEYPGPDG